MTPLPPGTCTMSLACVLPVQVLEAFAQDFTSRVWCTYRKSFPPLGEPLLTPAGEPLLCHAHRDIF